MNSARPYPPSAQRIAEARASGHHPRASLVCGNAALVVALALGFLLGARWFAGLVALFRATMSAWSRADAAGAYRLLTRYAHGTLLSCTLAALGLTLLVTASCVLARGPRGGRAREPARARFPRLAPGRTAPLLFALGLALVTGLSLGEVLALDASSLLGLASRWAWGVALIAVLTLIVDVAFAQARFYASLRMTRRELLDEQRAAFGAPELRALRQRLLREAQKLTRRTPAGGE